MILSQHKQTNKPFSLDLFLHVLIQQQQPEERIKLKKITQMKIKTHLHNLSLLSICSNTNNNGYITDQGFNTSSSSSSSSSPTLVSHSHYRGHHHRLRSSSSSNKSHRQDNNNNHNFFLSILLRRHLRLFLLVPLFYISGLLMYTGTFSSILNPPTLPGSVYRSPQIFSKLWPQIHSDNASAIQLSSMWKYRHRLKEEKSCKNITSGQHSGSAEPRGYLIVDANGGLNQQRSSICNAVAVAAVLNAILVIPHFDFHNIWKDPSGFGDIYDVNHFINSLEGYVKVVRELPMELMEKYDYNISNVSNVRVKAWAPVSYYLGEVYPILNEQGVIRIAPFANRLAMEVPPNIQLLRCLTNYRALRFSAPISTLAEQLVNRMIEKSFKTGGKYVSVHLRFEEDMVAFSCCVYDGGKTEELEMDYAREKGWRDKFKQPTRIIRPDLNRINGKCPLTPLEVGMMLRGMGFDNNTSIYLASGKIYHAEKNLAPLLKMFPLLQTKETLVTSKELAYFEGYASRLAALDYTVCLFSEVFVTTQGGNFPHFLMGHRRFLYGHAKTIKPDKRKLVLLLQDMSISWNAFKEHMKSMLVESDRAGMMLPRIRKASRRSSIYANPSQECMCLRESPNSTVGSIHLIHAFDQKKPEIRK